MVQADFGSMSDEELDALLADAAPVIVPENLSFNAAEIMALAGEEMAKEAGSKVSVREHVRGAGRYVSRKGSPTYFLRRYASLAAAFVLLLGAGVFAWDSYFQPKSADSANQEAYFYSAKSGLEEESTNACMPMDDADSEAKETAGTADSAGLVSASYGGESTITEESGETDIGVMPMELHAKLYDMAGLKTEGLEESRNPQTDALWEEAMEDGAFKEAVEKEFSSRTFVLLTANMVEENVEFVIYLYDSSEAGEDAGLNADNLRYITWTRK